MTNPAAKTNERPGEKAGEKASGATPARTGAGAPGPKATPQAGAGVARGRASPPTAWQAYTAPLCKRHGLATAPDGRCIVCRREGSALEKVTPQRGLLLLGLVAFAVCVAVLGRVLSEVSFLNPRQTTIVRAGSALTADPDHAREPSDPRASAEAVDTEPKNGSESEAEGAVAAANVDSFSEPGLGATADAEVPVAAPPVGSEAGAAAAVPAAPALTKADVRGALDATSVVMFSTETCPHCARARAFLAANGIRYTELDIDKNADARSDLERRTGQTAVPTFIVDGEASAPGFSPERLGNAMARAVERRLGVPGAEIRFKPGAPREPAPEPASL